MRWLGKTLLTFSACALACHAIPQHVVSNRGDSWRNRRPVTKAALEIAPPRVIEGSLRNGLRFVVHQRRTLPITTVRLIVRGGAREDPPNCLGLSRLTAYLLSDGDGLPNPASFRAQLDALGAEFTMGTDLDAASFTLTVPTKNIYQSLSLVSMALTTAHIDEAGLDKARSRVLADIAQEHRGSKGASSMARRLLYPSSSRNGRSVYGVAEDVKQISSSDIEKFYAAHYGPVTTTLVLSGSMATEEVRDLLEGLFGSWRPSGIEPKGPSGASLLGASSKASDTPKPRAIVIIDAPDAASVTLAVAFLLPSRDANDWASAEAAAYALGGASSARLNQELRGKQSWTYGVFAAITPHLGESDVVFRGDIRTESVGMALRRMLDIIDALSTEPPAAAELLAVKNMMALDAAWDLQTNTGVVSFLAATLSVGLPAQAAVDRLHRVASLETRDVARAGRDYLTRGHEVVVLRGPKAEVTRQLADVGLVATRVVTP